MYATGVIYSSTCVEYQPHINVVGRIIGYGWDTGPRLNIKTVLSTYGDFHVKDKTAVRTSYL